MSKCKIAVLISGGGSNLQSIIDATLSGEIDGQVIFVVSNKKKAYGLERAFKHNIENAYIGRLNYPDFELRSEELLKQLEDYDIDLIIMAGYLEILHKNVIKNYRNRIINIHPSLIPNYCGKGFYGMRVHNKVRENNEKYSGATVHFVDEGIDTGQLILQEAVKIESDDSPEDIQKKVLKIEHKILVQSIKKFAAGEI